MNNQKRPSLAESIERAISAKHVHMRPRAFFVAGSVLLGIGAAAAVVVAIFFTGVALFRIRVNAPHRFLLEGPGGFSPFLDAMPWIPIVIATVGIASGILLIRQYGFGYKRALPSVLVGFIAATLIFGYVIDTAGLPDRAVEFKPLHLFVQERYEGEQWVVGVVTEIHENSIILATADGDTVEVHVDNETSIQPNTPIRTGTFVRVLGDRNDDVFYAEILLPSAPPRGHIQYRLNIPRQGIPGYPIAVQNPINTPQTLTGIKIYRVKSGGQLIAPGASDFHIQLI